MKYLVTGGAGFIGSNIVRRLLTEGNQVTAIDNLSTGRKDNIIPFLGNKNFNFIFGDIRDLAAVKAAAKGADYILHQAALPSVPRSVKDPVTTNEVNITGTLNILEAAREFKIKRVVYASSSSIYGNNLAEFKQEDFPVKPMSPYAISKYTGERYCQVYYQIYGLETVCLRYFNVFGINQDPDSEYSAVIPLFIKKIICGERPVIHGTGMQSRDFTFVENNVEANLLACRAEDAKGEVINIACGESYNLITLVSEINRILNKSIEPVFTEARPGDVPHSRADISKAQKILGYKVKINFPTGLEKTVEHLIKETNKG